MIPPRMLRIRGYISATGFSTSMPKRGEKHSPIRIGAYHSFARIYSATPELHRYAVVDAAFGHGVIVIDVSTVGWRLAQDAYEIYNSKRFDDLNTAIVATLMAYERGWSSNDMATEPWRRRELGLGVVT
jgi:hypothetical protein